MKRVFCLLLPLVLLLCGCAWTFEAGGQPFQTTAQTVETTEEPTPEPPAPLAWAGLTMEELTLTPFVRTGIDWLTVPDVMNGVDREAYYPGLLSGGIETYTESATGRYISVIKYTDSYGEDASESIQIQTDGKDRLVYQVEVRKYSGALGPHGIKNGMRFDEVMTLMNLPIEREGQTYEELFTENSAGSDDGTASCQAFTLPPKVTVSRKETTTEVKLICPEKPYPADMDIIDYVYQTHYTVTLTFDTEGVLTAWSWYIGAFAE